MRQAIDLLAQYAEYHRDRRNITTHLIGVPMIVFAIGVLLARPGFEVANLLLTPAWLVFAAAAVWWLTRGDLVLGIAVSAATALLIWMAQPLAAGSTLAWLATGIGIFVVGWIVQFIGHWYEGRKPAFVDDLTGLLIGPMFVVAELLFSLGWNKPLLAEIERRAGPTHIRNMAHPA